MCAGALLSTLERKKKTDHPREGREDGTPPPHRDFKLAMQRKKRKKTDTPNEGWDEDRVPTCTGRILEGRSGGQVGLSCS